MFVRSRVIQALESNAGRFRSYQTGNSTQMMAFRNAIEEIASLSRAKLEDRLRAIACPGARPTHEQDCYDTVCIPFDRTWGSHEEARAWALDVLRGRPTFAVDGSQIPPQRAFSIPVAVIQIGWYENPHLAGGQYEKDVEIRVLPPDEITYDSDSDERADSELIVGLTRYRMEVERIQDYMRARSAEPVKPVVFFDGSLVASFASRLSPGIRDEYVRATSSLLATSEATRVPLIGYVDNSYARDLVEMVRHATGLSPCSISDGHLLSPGMTWGDRSPAYVCARDDGVLTRYQDPDTGRLLDRSVGFLHLKTTRDNSPVRLEFPLWLLESGSDQLEHVLDVVRAETIVGNGYPYPLETADAVAVLTLEDRQRFYQTFQQFANRHGLAMHYSRKALSKRQRRV